MDEPRGNGGRRGRGGPAEDERAAAGRRGPREEDGFWADERPRRSAPSRDEGERPRRSRAAYDDMDDRPRRSRRAGGDLDEERPRRRAAAVESGGAGGRRRTRGDGDPGERPPRRRPDEGGRGGRRRVSAHGARAEAGGAGGRRRARRDEDEELDERGPVKRFFAKAWKPALITFSVLFILGVVGVGIAYVMAPSPEEMDSQADVDLAATLVTFEDGDKATQFGESQRIPVTIDQIPDSVIDGVLAAEQRTFYEDGAINPIGLARGVIFGGTQGGGSTITQQMARNYYDGLTRNEPSRVESYIRKFNEIMIAFKVEQSLSKDQIIEQYLNTIYFGRGLGVQTAAQGYFGKDVSELDYAEGAFIGTVIQQPGNFGPAVPGSDMYAILEERWGYTVDGLVEMNAENPDRGLTREEADALEFPEPLPQSDNDNYSGYRGYIQEAVRAEMADRYGLSDQQIARGGYQITTTLNEDWMKYAEEVVEAEKERVLNDTGQEIPAETQFGITTVDPATGEIKAFYGGPDPTQYANQSLVQRQQAGSAFKPYVLATALEQGISLRSTYDGDGPKEFAGLSQPVNNDSNVNYGPVDLIQSTKDSINTSYVQLAEQVTPPAVLDTALAAGIPQEQLDTAEPGPNIALGTVSVSALDQAGGFATFANGGVHMPRHMIKEIIGSDGEPLVPNDAELLVTGSEAFSPETAADATYAMQQVITPDHNARLDDGRPMAGKTGTSNDAVSAWFVGFIPQLSTAVGLHRSDSQPLVLPGEDSIYGGQMPSRIWKAYMTKVLDGFEHESFPEPVYGGEVQSHVPTPTPDPSPSESAEMEPSSDPTPSPDPSPSESSDAAEPDCEEQWWLSQCMEQESPEPGASSGPPGGGGGAGGGGGGGGGSGGNNDNENDNGFL